MFPQTGGKIRFSGEIVAAAAVDGGIYVSTNSKLYFLQGTGPRDFHMRTKGTAGVIPGTEVAVDGIAVSGGQYDRQLCYMWTAYDGIYLGTSAGDILNLTKDRVVFDRYTWGTAYYDREKYVVSLGSFKELNKLTVCVDLMSGAVTQYGGYNFNGMTAFDQMRLGGNSNGLFLLKDGDLDGSAEIEAFFETGKTDFGTSHQKRQMKVVLGYRTDGNLQVTSFPDIDSQDNKRVSYQREMAANKKDLSPHSQEVTIGYNQKKARYHAVEVRNLGGSDFTVHSMHSVVSKGVLKPEEGR
jgi:hypothetical protein